MIRDDFAGPGGWSQGLRLLNLSDEEVGVEFDKAAVDTARTSTRRITCSTSGIATRRI